MKKISLFTTALLLFLHGSASADILMKWDRKPLPIELQVNQERILFVDKNVKVGYPQELNGKLRIQSSGGAVYLKAEDSFPVSRLQLVDLGTGELILLDVEAKASIPNAAEPIRFIYDENVAKASVDYNQDSPVIDEGDSTPPQSRLPAPAALTRYAAQMFYAPLRTVEPLEGVRQVAHRLPQKITTLLPALPVQATPLLSWQLDGYIVTAIRLQNKSMQHIELDPRELQGRFYAATFQHTWLGGQGSLEDTTTLYLVTEGYANHAVIPEGKKYQPKKLKKVTTTVTMTTK